MNKYSEDFKLLDNKKVRSIVDAARIEFGVYGITNTKLKNIAKSAKVGEATLYRNFTDKTALAKLVAFDYWFEESSLYEDFLNNQVSEKDNGLESVLNFLKIFKELYVNHRPFLKFLEDFDNYMMSIDNVPLKSSFEDMILDIKETLLIMIKHGISDGSIKETIDPNDIYSFVSQVMVSTTQKMAIRVGYLESDEGLNPIKVLDNLCEMLICVIKNEEQA